MDARARVVVQTRSNLLNARYSRTGVRNPDRRDRTLQDKSQNQLSRRLRGTHLRPLAVAALYMNAQSLTRTRCERGIGDDGGRRAANADAQHCIASAQVR